MNRRTAPIRATACVLACTIAGGMALALPGAAGGEAASSTVTVTVASATTLDVTACGSNRELSLGSLMPNDTARTAQCTVTFGSSNNTSMLRLHQADRAGTAMFGTSLGALDGGFGSSGVATAAGAPSDPDAGYAVAVNAAGDVFVAGMVDPSTADTGDIAVSRFSSTGAAVGTWGASGWATLPTGEAFDSAADIALQPDGLAVVAGEAVDGGVQKFAVARFLDNGTADSAFAGGSVMTTMGTANSYATGVAVQRDGRIVVVGRALDGDWDMAVARYTAGGVLDDTFGTGGRVYVDSGGADEAVGVAVMSDGRIVVAGNRFNGTDYDFVAARLTSSGVLDTGFGGGVVSSDFTGDDLATAMAVDKNGRVVVVGDRLGLDVVVARYTAGGALDTTFSGNGWEITDLGNEEYPFDVVLDARDRPLVAGYRLDGTDPDPMVLRYTNAGALDSAYATNGVADVEMGAGTDEAQGIALGVDGDVVVAGIATAAQSDMFAAVMGGTCVADYAAAGPNWAGPAGTGIFAACLEQVTGAGVGPVWTAEADLDCAIGDTDQWKPVAPQPSDTGAKVAEATTSGVDNATARLRFGTRIGSTQAAGEYDAALTFEVVAPNAP